MVARSYSRSQTRLFFLEFMVPDFDAQHIFSSVLSSPRFLHRCFPHRMGNAGAYNPPQNFVRDETIPRGSTHGGLATGSRRERRCRRLRHGALPCSEHTQTPPAGSGFRVRRERDSGAGTEPGNEIPVGANGTCWQKGDAVLERGPLRGKRSRWEGDSLR